jgi:hypothetical protein
MDNSAIVACRACGASATGFDKAEAATAWNARAPATQVSGQAASVEPDAWISHDRATGKDRYDRLPLQSLQPGLYAHTPLYKEVGLVQAALNHAGTHATHAALVPILGTTPQLFVAYGEREQIASLAAPVAPQTPQITPADAVYGLLAWLSGRDEVVTLSARHGATIAADLAKAFCEQNGLQEFGADYPDNLKYQKCTLAQFDRPAARAPAMPEGQPVEQSAVIEAALDSIEEALRMLSNSGFLLRGDTTINGRELVREECQKIRDALAAPTPAASAAPIALDWLRSAILEEAALICERREERSDNKGTQATCRLCAKDIQAIKVQPVVNQSLTTDPTSSATPCPACDGTGIEGGGAA